MTEKQNFLKKLTSGLGKGITKMGAGSQIIQLRGQKWMLERQRDALYRELGCTVYEQKNERRADLDAAIRKKVDEIREVLRCLSDVTLQMEDYGALIHTPITHGDDEPVACQCGAFFEKGSRTCAQCGKKLEEALAGLTRKDREEAETMRCPDCSSVVGRGMVFCPHCGSSLDRPGW